MGGIFFRRAVRPRAEVINDVSRDVVTLFRILQRHYPQFLDTLRFQITSRAEFARLVKTDPDTLTQLEQWRGVLGEAPIENIGFFGLKSGPGEKCSGTFSLSL
ncbi:MAG: hypothetical protein H7841_13755, partial [Magnetospirillum sp. WYHS-4]